MVGQIVYLKAGDYAVYFKDLKKIYKGKASGKFRFLDESPKVGDFVECEFMNETNIYITKINKRINDLERPSICNIDQAMIVFSVVEPILNTNLLDRLLTILSFYNIKVIIIFTKYDLVKTLNESDCLNLEKTINYYETIGYEIYKMDKLGTYDKNLLKIKSLFKDKITVITGQSGVGKSNLLNMLHPELSLATNDISQALGRGKHTTRHVELLELDEGWVADTPGFGTTDFFSMTEQDLATNFIDFFKVSCDCKYKGCLHLKEPHCKVKEEITKGTILESRYINYQSFIEEIKKGKKW